MARLDLKQPLIFHPFSALFWLSKHPKSYSDYQKKFYHIPVGMVLCPRCGGDKISGPENNSSKYWSCKLCHSDGFVMPSEAEKYLNLKDVDCLECDGNGMYWMGNDDGSSDWCNYCSGSGFISQKKMGNEITQREKNYKSEVQSILHDVSLTLALYVFAVCVTSIVAVWMGRSEGWISGLISIPLTLLLLVLLGFTLFLFFTIKIKK